MPTIGRRYNLGIQLPILRTRFTQVLLRQAMEAANDHDVNLWAFVGNSYGVPLQERAGNIIYEYINKENVDGIIASTGSLFYHAAPDDIPADRLPYKRLPSISLSRHLGSVPMVAVDNRAGAYEAVDHLISHGYTRIAIVQGIGNSQEAQDRKRGWEDCLRDHGLNAYADLVFDGDYTRSSGVEAIRTMCGLDILPGRVDAVFFANDDMAIGAIQECQRRGLRVPGDLAIAGFDNNPDADMDHYNITTIDQNYSLFMDTAFNLLLMSIDGHMIEEKTQIPPKLVVRGSCGCTGFTHQNPDPQWQLKGLEAQFAILEQQFASKYFHKPVNMQWVSDFTAEFKNAISSLPDAGIHFWTTLLTRFEATLLRRYQGDEETILISGMLSQLAATQFQTAITVKSTRSTIQEEQFTHLSGMIQTLNSSTSMDDLHSLIVGELGKLRIGYCRIFRYSRSFDYCAPGDGGPGTIIPPKAFQILHVENGVDMPVIREELPEAVLMLPNLETRRNYLVMPLNHGDIQLGYIIFEADVDRYFVYDTLRTHVASALNAVEMVERLQLLTRQDDLTGLLNRRGFMEMARLNYMLSLRNGMGGAVFFIDLDGMKGINDRFGHAVGDEFIRIASSTLKSAIRETDVIGRIGGDEFVILAINADNDAVNVILNRINEAIFTMNSKADRPWTLGMSIGVKRYGPSDPNGLEKLMGSADEALYRAKREKAMSKDFDEGMPILDKASDR